MITVTDSGFFTPWGQIEEGQPRPELGRVGHLMITTTAYLIHLLEVGPIPAHSCPSVLHSAEFAADGFHYAQVDYAGQRWRWRLHPARFSDDSGEPIWLGVWPD